MTEVAERPTGLESLQGGGQVESYVWTRLVTNFKGQADWTLGPLTMVIGPNQRGKTALLESFRLALTGRHPAVRGSAQHPEGNPREVVELFSPEGENRLFVTLETAGGVSTASYLAEQAGRTYTRTHRSPVQPQGLGFEEDLSDLLKTGNKVRNALLRQFGQGARLACPSSATELGRRVWDAAIREVASMGDGVVLEAPEGQVPSGELSNHLRLDVPVAEVLVRIATRLDSTKRSLGRQKGELDRKIQASGATGEVAGVEQLDGLREQLAQARASEAAEPKRQLVAGYDQDRGQIEAGLAALPEAPSEEEVTRRLAEIDEEAQRIAGQIAPLEVQVAEDQGRLSFGQSVLPHLRGAVQGEGHHTCFFCGSKADMKSLLGVIEESIPRVGGRLAANQGRLQSLRQRAQTLGAERLNVAASARNAREQRVQQERFLTQRKAALDARAPEIEKLRESLPKPWTGLPADVLQRRIDELSEAEKEANKHDALMAELAQLDEQQSVVKGLEKQVVREASKLQTEAAIEAEKAANAWAIPGMEIVYDADAHAWAVAGGTRDERYHDVRAASGFERSMLLPALAMAFQTGDPRYILLDDAITGTFDRPHLAGLAKVLKDRVESGDVAQVILVLPPVLGLATPAELKDLTEGWHVLQM